MTPIDPKIGSNGSAPLIYFAGGGTGGHLYPALALAQALRDRMPDLRFKFLGTQRAIDRHILGAVQGEFYPQVLPALSLRPWHWPRMFWRLRSARREARAFLRADRPVSVIGTGGMASVPAVREAADLGIPCWLLNPDARPGRANRFLAKFVEGVFCQWEVTATHFRAECCVRHLGCPIRRTFFQANRLDGLRHFKLDSNCKTLLITGASQGAHTINEAILGNLDFLNSLNGWQFLHLTGQLDHAVVQDGYSAKPLQAVVLPYTDYMPLALGAADLVISRAGASTLAEIAALGKPSILMPYPYHRDQHQVANAECLVRKGAARLVLDQRNGRKNIPALRRALEDLTSDTKALDTMSSAARRLTQGDASGTIATEILARLRMRG